MSDTKVFCLEGISGAGKTTQTRLIGKYLASINQTFLMINEKEYEPFRQTIIDWHNNGANQVFTNEVATSIAKSRGETHKIHFTPLMGNIDYLFFDRSFYTSGIYQSDGELSQEEIIDLNLNEDVLLPEKGLILLCSPETAIERTNKRRLEKNSYSLPSMHETLSEIKKRKVLYENLLSTNNQFELVNTEGRNESEIFGEIKELLGI